MLDPNHSRRRQQRLLARLSEARLDAAVLALPHHVYYFSAFRPCWLHRSAFVLMADGRSWLARANEPAPAAAADEVVTFEASWNATLRQEQPVVVAAMIADLLKSWAVKRVGIDASAVTSQLVTMVDARCEPIDPILWQMRRAKDPDELELMQTAIRCTEVMHARAREIVEPGVPELHVFAELHAAAVETAGEPLTALLGNDYACGVAGGPPRKDRACEAGEVYVLDLGPAYRGYFADNCRAIAVDRKPTDAQMRTWHAIVDCFPIVEKMAKPGVRCRDICAAVDDHLRAALGSGMPHHLGHGVGLEPHEFPHLNPAWDDVLIEGEVFTVEPGHYAPELAGGIRIENDYLVTGDGVRNLLNSPMELV